MPPTLGLILGFLLLIVLFLYTFWPEKTATGSNEKSEIDYLVERREQIEENLRDLNFENSAGKFPAEEYEKQRGILDGEAAKLTAEIARLKQA